MNDSSDPADPPVEGVFIHDGLTIPEREIRYSFSRSGGPGGQNVNKVSTRATLLFAVSDSSALTPEQVARIHERLASRLGADGVLRVVAQEHRSQMGNRLAARKRFARLLADAFNDPPERRDTNPPPSVDRRRLEAKRHRSRLKKARGAAWRDDD
ncbi:MAG: alternative ribosome rescue aminoacyl-tRNA hydrolase ArfB [Thermoleophilia bacterium]